MPQREDAFMAEQQQNQEQVLLKTSFFGGFDKGEVLSYIDRLREQNRTMAAELEGKLDGMARARGELAEQVTGFEGKISEMERQLDASAGRIRELTGMVETLKGAVAEQQRQCDAKERELRTQKEQTRQISLRAQNYEYKARRYEELSTQIGDILLETREDAGKLLQQAEREADRIKSAAVTASEKVAEEMRSMRTDLAAVREHIAGLLDSMNQRLDEIDRMLLEADPASGLREQEKQAPSGETQTEEAPQPQDSAPENLPDEPAAQFFRGAADV